MQISIRIHRIIDLGEAPDDVVQLIAADEIECRLRQDAEGIQHPIKRPPVIGGFRSADGARPRYGLLAPRMMIFAVLITPRPFVH